MSPDQAANGDSALSTDPDWRAAITDVIEALPSGRTDIGFLFISSAHREQIPDIVEVAWELSGASLMIGASSNGIAGAGQEIEAGYAISMLSLSLPGATLRPIRLTSSLVEDELDPDALAHRLGIVSSDIKGVVVLTDRTSIRVESLLDQLSAAWPGISIVGGATNPMEGETDPWLILNGETYRDGAIGLGIGGAWEIEPVISQGCEPIGEVWTITGATGRSIETISNKSAEQILTSTLRRLPDATQQQAWRDVAIGIAANEYQDSYRRGDFLVRNISGLDSKRGRLFVNGRPRVGQTAQFQIRDASTADLDLKLALSNAASKIQPRIPAGALLFRSADRGDALFDAADHDTRAFRQWFEGVPLSGMVCRGEISPNRDLNHLHGFAASYGIIVPSRVDDQIGVAGPTSTGAKSVTSTPALDSP